MQDIAADGRVLLSQLNLRISLHAGAPGGATDRDLSWFGYSVANDVSGDGARLLFSDQPAPSGRPRSLLLRGVDGGPAVRLGDGFYHFNARLSLDGRFVAARGPDPEDALRIEPTGAGEGRELPRGGLARIESWAWWPDSMGLVVSGSRADGSAAVVEQSLSGGDPRLVPAACDPRRMIAVSPDGRFVACPTHDGLALAARDGSSRRELATSEPVGSLICWSTDGRGVFSYRQGDLPAAILRTDLATGRVEVVRRLQPPDATGVWRVHPIVVTPDGRHWAYSAARWLGDLYVYSGLR